MLNAPETTWNVPATIADTFAERAWSRLFYGAGYTPPDVLFIDNHRGVSTITLQANGVQRTFAAGFTGRIFASNFGGPFTHYMIRGDGGEITAGTVAVYENPREDRQ